MKTSNNNIWFIFVLVFFLLIPAAEENTCAAELSGTVRNSETNEPLVDVTVIIAEYDTGARTDENGVFTVKNIPNGDCSIQISSPGYKTITTTVRIPAEQNIVFELYPSTYSVEEVISTARGRNTRLDDIPGSVEVLTDKDFQEINPVSIPAALSRKPGLAVSSEMPWSSRPVIRGMTKDKIILLVDGARVVTATATAAQFGTIALGDIERVELLKGPISVLYGSGSTGGVVNVITKTGSFSPEPRVTALINPAYESGANGLSSTERVGWSNAHFYVNLSQSNRRYTDYYAAGMERIPNSQFQDRQTGISLGAKITPHHTLEARYQHFSVLDAGLPGGETFPLHAQASYPKTSRTLANIGWTWVPGTSWFKQSKISVYHQPVERFVKLLPNSAPAEIPHPSDPGKFFRLTPESIFPEAKHDVYGGRWQNELSFNGHSVVAGIEGWQKNMTSNRIKNIKRELIDQETGSTVGDATIITIKDTPVPNSSQFPLGIFAEDVFQAGRNLSITLGSRIDRIYTENDKAYLTDQPVSSELVWDTYNDTDISWSFVSGAVYHAAETLDFNLTVARSFRSPTLEERYLYADLGGIVTVGDPGIDSENGLFTEAGVRASLGPARFWGQVFQNSITDMVILSPGGELNGNPVDYHYANAGRALLRGFEAGVDWTAAAALLVSADVSYVRGTDERDNTNLPSMPPASIHLSARYRIGKTFWVEPFVSLVDKQNNVAAGEKTTSGYGKIDVSFEKTIQDSGRLQHNVVIGIKNIGDKQYRDHLTVSRGYEMYGMGRSFYISWRTTH